MKKTKEFQEKKELRHFGLIMAFAFLILGTGIPLIKHRTFHPVLTGIALLFLIVAIFVPDWLKTTREWWLMLGEKLGLLNSRILFTILYLTLFSVIHLIFKLMGRDKFKRKWRAYDSTYTEKQKISAFTDPF